MAIADFFRPKYKNSKPEVRAAAVAAMDKDDIELLIEVASADVDLSIRKSAIAKIEDPEVLASVAESQDTKLRDYATSLAVKKWISTAITSDDLSEAKICFNHAATHGGEKAVAEIAGNATLALIRSQALARIRDEKALALVVRNSQKADEWQEALSRIEDQNILRSIAVDEKRKEVAQQALERIEDSKILDDIAAKAKNKSIRGKAKRLKASLLKEQAPVSSVSDLDKRSKAERVQLVREAKGLADGHEWLHSRDTMDSVLERWGELGGDQDDSHTKNFQKACLRYEAFFAKHGKAAKEKAVKAAAKEKALVLESSVVVPLEEKAEAKADVATISVVVEPSVVAAPSEPSEAALAEQDRQHDNQDALERLCEQLEELSESGQMRGFDKRLKEIDRNKRKIGRVPKAVVDSLSNRYEEAWQKAVISLGELREADEWKRWSTVPKMEALVAKSKELLANVENTKVGQELKNIQKAWRELGAAPRKKGDELWEVFKNTCDEVYEVVKVEREKEKEEQEENYLKKEELAVRAEELKGSTDWKEASELFKSLQSDWKALGAVPRRKSKKQWDRFRKACDAFFEARAPHLEEQHLEQEENLADKEALIEEVKSLANTDGDIEEQITAVRELQHRWRDIGLVPRKEFESQNKRYKAECDRVYAKRKEALNVAQEQEHALLSEIESTIAECTDAERDSDAKEIATKVLEVRSLYLSLEPSIAGHAELGERVTQLINTQLETEPEAYEGSVLCIKKSEAAREALLQRAQEALPIAPEPVAEDETADAMAERLKAALSKRALGGIFDQQSQQTLGELVQELEQAWLLISPLPGAKGTELKERFELICAELVASEKA